MSKEKTLEAVQSEDEIKDTDEQSEGLSQDETDEEQDVEQDTEADSEDEAAPKDEKKFKSREERAEFFKNKQKEQPAKDVLTRSELFKMNERKAIREMTVPADSDSDEQRSLKQEINDNWNSIVAEFNPNTDRSDVEAIKRGILKAHLVWRSDHPAKEKDVDTEARANLMADHGTRGSTGKGTAAPKKTILGTPSKGMDDWYPKGD